VAGREGRHCPSLLPAPDEFSDSVRRLVRRVSSVDIYTGWRPTERSATITIIRAADCRLQIPGVVSMGFLSELATDRLGDDRTLRARVGTPQDAVELPLVAGTVLRRLVRGTPD
jgi:hypothetical protein